MHAIEISAEFHASHALRLPDGASEPVHAHDWRVTLQVTADRLDALETVADFHVVQAALAAALAPWRGRLLNEIEPFKTRVNPSAERVAEEIGRQMMAALGCMDGAAGRRVRLLEARATEAAGCLAIWRPE